MSQEDLEKIINSIQEPGHFCAGGELVDFCLPGLVVDGVGSIGLPILDYQAKKLIKKCSLAPYGKGEKTVVDTNVRNTWQLDPNQFKIQNPK
jgi:hypothetical protein